MTDNKTNDNENIIWFTMRFDEETGYYKALRLKETQDGAIVFEVQHGKKGKEAEYIRFKLGDNEMAELSIKLLKLLLK